ncbi:MAG: DUF885 family protein [Lachnospiraceae bacterium]|nr:DUF885 family protein [Lachnospiraceae bacterium]
MRNKRKAAVLALPAAVAVAAVAGIFCLVRLSSFGTFCEKLAKSSLSNNPVKLHYTFADPQSAGYGGLSRDLYAFDPDSYGADTDVWQAYLEKLDRYDPEKLTEEEAFTWEILYRYFTLEGELSEYLYYETPLSPADGTHIQMPVLLAEYRFYEREDVENYLTLLSQLPDYFRGLLTYTEMQAQAGVLQYEGNLRKAAEQCESILTAEELAAGTHFLQTTFAERLKEMLEEEPAGITAEEVEICPDKNNRLLAQLAETYAELAEGLQKIVGTEEITGLSSYPGGAEYYALLLKEATGLDQSVEEMKAVLYARFEELYAEYKEVIASGNIISEYEFPLENEVDMLKDLYQRMQADFPLALSSVSWTVTLKPVEEGLEEMMAPAFYLTPPVDLNGRTRFTSI